MNTKEVTIPVIESTSAMQGTLTVVPHSEALVIFTDGSGSSRLSSRNAYVARILNQAKISTLLFDLLTAEEDAIDQITRQFRLNIPLLAQRLITVTNWVHAQTATASMALGYCAASTSAGAALVAAAQLPDLIKAVVSRGGRPDLAGSFLEQVQAPILLLVGERDQEVIHLNEIAYDQLTSIKQLEIVAGAGHLFEEPGTLQNAAELARDWFSTYLG